MNYKSLHIKLIIPCLILFLSGQDIFAQKESGELAIAKEQFEKGNIEEAEKLFLALNKKYPKEPEYIYYLGRCYLQASKNSQESVDFLKMAAAKHYNTDVHYYLAQAYCQAESFADAEISLSNFIKLTPKRKLKKYDLEFVKSRIEAGKKNESKSNIKEHLGQEYKLNIVEASETVPSEFDSVDKGALLSNGKSESGGEVRQQVVIAMNFQNTSDSLNSYIIDLENELSNATDELKRKELASLLSQAKREQAFYQHKADSVFRMANLDQSNNQVVQSTMQNADSVIYFDREINGIKVYKYKTDELDETVSEAAVSSDLAINSKEQNRSIPDSFVSDKIDYNIELPEGLVYRIQLGVFSQEVGLENFKDIRPISAEKSASNNLTKYFTGFYYSIAETKVVLEDIKIKGFKDAFVVPYFNGEKISIQKARELEFGQKK